MSVKVTTAYWKIKDLKTKIKIIQGGQGASKTFSILTLILEKVLGEPTRATIVSATYPQLRDGAIADMRIICRMAGIDFDRFYNITDKNLKLGESLIEFRHIDNKDFHKAKGVRRDILFVNEANRTGWLSIDQMLSRSKETFVDFNPDQEFWAHTELMPREDSELLILTYKDNEMLSEEERTEIESRRDNEEWWRVYGEGQIGIYSDAQIYSYEFVDKIPDTAKRIPSGMDFGVSPDPTTLVDLFKEGNKLYADELFCENNLLPQKLDGAERPAIVDRLDAVGHPKGRLIIADSAGATEINDLKKHKYNVKGVKKYPGSVIAGINKLRGYKLYLTKRSTHLKKGIEGYHFEMDLNGKVIPEPKGHEPDGLAAIRYVIMEEKKQRRGPR